MNYNLILFGFLFFSIKNEVIVNSTILLYSNIMTHNTNCSYVVPKSKIPFFLKQKDMIKSNGQPVFREINFNLGNTKNFNTKKMISNIYSIVGENVRYRVDKFYMWQPINDMVQRSVEHGFQNCFYRRSNRILGMVELSTNLMATEMDFITLSKLEYAFLVYLMGMVLGILVFFIEIYCTSNICIY